MDTTSVTDSTDWLSTPLSGLAPLESSLRCQVCKDFFTTPMITSCSHTFCSLCIRRYLSQEGRCPACRENDQEMKLRRNWVVEELVTQFTASRLPMLDFARNAVQRLEDETEAERRPAKRRKVNDIRGTDNRTITQARSTRSQTKRNATQTTASQQTPVSTQEEVGDSDDDAGSVYEDEQPLQSHHFDGSSEPNDGLVACPSCTRRMKESVVNTHLDKCLAGLADEPTSTPAPGQGSGTKVESSESPHPPHVKAGTIAYAQTKPSSTQRLPTLNYSLFNDNALRKKLKEYGIPNHGSKQLMIKRHMEWVNLYNANCDSLQPVSKLELRKALDQWERTLGRQVEREKGASGVMVKEFDRDRYAQKQKSEFEDLIAKARANRGAKRIVERVEEPVEEPVAEPQDVACSGASAERAIDLDGALEVPEQPPFLSNGIGLEPVTLPAAASSPAEEDSVVLMASDEPPQQQAESRWQHGDLDPPPPSSERSMNHDIMA